MKHIILALAMLTMVAVMALPAMARDNDGDDYNWGNDYDRGGYSNWWNSFYNQDSCDVYWSVWGPQYWCWSPFFGWYQLG